MKEIITIDKLVESESWSTQEEKIAFEKFVSTKIVTDIVLKSYVIDQLEVWGCDEPDTDIIFQYENIVITGRFTSNGGEIIKINK